MLDNLPHIKGDPLWDLIHQFKADPREDKIDLLVGVYRDESGQTPVMQQVKNAELKLARQAESKAYRVLSGNIKFNEQIAEFLLGDSSRITEQCTIQTVGGSGALRVLADLIAKLSPNAAIWNTEPGYINHQPIMEGAGLKVSHFRWQDKNEQLDIESCFADLEYAAKGDIVLLHGCCHNPTGIDPSIKQWQQLVDFCKDKELIPFIDMAYLGFGDTPDKDAAGLRLFVEQIDVVLIATSCSKNMGLYCERTGAATVITRDKTQLGDLRKMLERITRANYSVPPNHGSAIASLLFEHPAPWLEELSECRNRVVNNRQHLASALAELGAPTTFNAIAKQKGMFSLLPLSVEQMDRLRNEFGIYGIPNGRINIAGLKQSQIKTLAQALISVVSRQ